MNEFSLIKFQDALIATLVKCYSAPKLRQQAAGRLHTGKAEKKLRKLGFENEQVHYILKDCREMAMLQVEAARV